MNDLAAGMDILVADDEASIRFVLQELLEDLGHRVVAVEDGEEALAELTKASFDLAFIDIRMPGQTGIEVLRQCRDTGNDVSIVIMTAQNLLENAIESMKSGALDYLVKPFPLAEVRALVDKALSTRALKHEVRTLRRAVGRAVAPGGDRMVGSSLALLDIFKTIGKVAPRNVPVLIVGESGTGKELVAHAIHAASPRAEKNFIAINAAAIPRELLESELFGHERGAFTGATTSRAGRFREASGGTLFLDEIGDMAVELQAKLLRVLQSGEITPVGGRGTVTVDVRIIAATHHDLDEGVRIGTFREDLLYRLRVVPMSIPPLRDRIEDVRTLATHFVERYAPELAERRISLPPQSIERLEAHSWPGNVRELENAIKRALVLSTDDVLAPDDFDFLTTQSQGRKDERSLAEFVSEEANRLFDADENSTDIYQSLQQRVEKTLLEVVLERTQGNQIRAAARLGINRNTLRKKITELGIELPARN
ncbi:MAG: sigma-54 dependent transcriptional regulator [Myxococcota bacterium]